MKTINKVIGFFIENVSPFLILVGGVFVGYKFGVIWDVLNKNTSLVPRIIGSCVGFIVFGIISREAWNDLHSHTTIKEDRQEKCQV